MKTNAIIRELRNIDRNTFTALNKVFGYNFEKPFTTAKINGSFTINKIWKELDNKHNAHDSVVVALMVCDDNVCTWRNHTVTRILSDNIDIDFRMYSTNTKVWDTFFAKGDFHDRRKIAKKVYIIAQKKELMNDPKKTAFYDMRERFVYDGKYTRWARNCGDSDTYISRIELIDPQHNNKRFEYSPSYRSNKPYREISEIIDKSGYIINNKRLELIHRAEELRKARAAAGFKATDNTAIINGLKGRIDSLQNAICKALDSATSSEDIRAIEKVLSSWDGLGGVFRKYERILSGEREKSFSSIAAFNEALTETNALIDKIAAAL